METTLVLQETPRVKTQKRLQSPYRARPALVGTCLVLALIGLSTANYLVTPAALLTLPLIAFLVWREGEPPVLIFACAFQWLQATAAIFYTNQYGVSLEEAFGDWALDNATWLSIAAVVVLAVGIRVGLWGAGTSRGEELETGAERISIDRVIVLYGFAFVASVFLTRLAWLFTSITQVLLAIAAMKWAVVFLLCYSVLRQRRGYGYLAICIIMEFVAGFAGIFSSFKSVFFVLAVAAMSSSAALRGRRLVTTTVCFLIIFVTGVVWTAIKTDYRSFLAEGTSEEQEAVQIERKFSRLSELVQSINWENFTDGIDAMVLRVSYVRYFALTIENVPSRIPYEQGRLWGGAIVHILTPRLLFPDKPALSDSERTRIYAGVEVAGTEQSTSIGIGYVGESYIDYGPVGMFVPIFLLGVFYGVIYRCFVIRSRHKLVGSALAVSVLIFSAYEIETSNIKIVGGIVVALLAAGFTYKFFGSTISNFLMPSREFVAPRPTRISLVE